MMLYYYIERGEFFFLTFLARRFVEKCYLNVAELVVRYQGTTDRWERMERIEDD